MYKKTITVFLMFQIAIFSFGQTSDIAFNNPDSLTGLNDFFKIKNARVKSCKTEIFDFYKGHENSNVADLIRVNNFRTDGKISEEMYSVGHGDSGKWSGVTKYKYDTVGILLEKREFTNDSILSDKEVYTYHNNKLIKIQDEQNGKLFLKDSIVYNGNFKKMEFEYGAGGEGITSFNNFGKPIERIAQHEKNKPYSRITFEYDDKNYLIKSTMIWLDNKIKSLEDSYYLVKNDSLGRTIEVSLAKDDKVYILRKYSYDHLGNKVEQSMWNEKEMIWKEVFSYNEKGLLIKVEKFKGKENLLSTLVTYSYEYY